MQLKIHGIEENLQDPLKYRFPFFEEMMWYVAEHYLKKVKGPRGRSEISPWEHRGLAELVDWLKYYKNKKPQTVRSAQYINDALRSYLNNEEIPEVEKYTHDEDNTEEDSSSSYCVCNGKSDDQLWIGCSSCGGWYHQGCVGLTPAQVEQMEHYFCQKCTNEDNTTNSNTHNNNTTTATTASTKTGSSRGRGRGRGSGRGSANNANNNNTSSSTSTTSTGRGRGRGASSKSNNNGAATGTNGGSSNGTTGAALKRKLSGISTASTQHTTTTSTVPNAKRKTDASFTQPKAKKLKNM